MGTNDAREQLEVCKKVTTRQEEAMREALAALKNMQIGSYSAIFQAIGILEEALK